MEAGSYFWNAGIFLFKASVYLNELGLIYPDIVESAKEAVNGQYEDLGFLRLGSEAFSRMPSISVDYALFEKTKKAAVVALKSVWNDVGSWESLRDIKDANKIRAGAGLKGINTKKNFDKKIVSEIKKITKLPFKPAKNKFAALAAHDAIVNYSGTLNTTAVCLMKVANDIRFLGSGPRAGYGELLLPENEPGSSIMPGKVNPTQCEAVTMVCAKVIGNHTGITVAGSHGHFELNVFKPLIAYNILQSIDLLADSVKNFSLYCVEGIKANEKKIKEHLDNSLMLVTALSPKIGYDKAAHIAKRAYKNGTTLKQEVVKAGLIKESDYDKIMSPLKMTNPK